MIEIAKKILNDVLNIKQEKITRFTTGYCHSVYYVKTEKGEEYVLRITSETGEKYYLGSIKWLPQLYALRLPVPEVLNYGRFENVYYTLISYIKGRDLGDVYRSLTETQKRNIARELYSIQQRVVEIKSTEYGYMPGVAFKTWNECIENGMKEECNRIKENGVFDLSVCDKAKSLAKYFENYFSTIKPIAFLEDTTTKNVLIHNGKLAGIVDCDFLCFGDSLRVVALTNMSLLYMKQDTKYVDYWLEEMNVTEIQRKAMIFYTLLNCIGFMSNLGRAFGNGIKVEVEHDKIQHLKCIYDNLVKALDVEDHQ